MAKRNSTKTATKEAQAASEPRVINFGQWTGININEAPDGFHPLEEAYNGNYAESDLPDNFLELQNNVVTTSLKALETRYDSLDLCHLPEGSEFSSNLYRRFKGITFLHEGKLFAVVEYVAKDNASEVHMEDLIDDELWCYDMGSTRYAGVDTNNYERAYWNRIPIKDDNRDTAFKNSISSVSVYANTLIVFAKYKELKELPQYVYPQIVDSDAGCIYVGDLDKAYTDGVKCYPEVPDPIGKRPILEVAGGDLHKVDGGTPVSRVQVRYCLTNRFGSTLPSDPSAALGIDASPVEFHSGRYIQISVELTNEQLTAGVTGVDFYCALNESQDYIFIGHASVLPNQQTIKFNWFGSLTDTSQWTSVQLALPTANETKGVDAKYCDCHDGRLYFYGGSIKNRLYIGGDPGAELSVARGLGGGFVDLDPGTGLVINSTHKFKTYNGASIVTIMCGNKNTSKTKRFNLLETNLTLTNELQSKGYEAEEVPNVIGCNSHWGSGVWEDGLYALSRYGLGITTMQMEESNTLSVKYLSDNISPIFTERISSQLQNCRMIYINGVIYIVLAVPGKDNDEKPDNDISNPTTREDEHTGLDWIIICYDIAQKAWYTLSYLPTETQPPEINTKNEPSQILHIFNFDYDRWVEGIGIVQWDRIVRIPVTGQHFSSWGYQEGNQHYPKPPRFTALIETGELGLRIPPQIYVWLAQLEFRFDYIIGDLDIEIFGRDYYGRHYRVFHHVTTQKDGKYELIRNYPVWIRVDKNVQTYRVRIKGKAHFRMTHFMSKTYQQSDKMAVVYGYDAHVDYMGRHGELVDDHHYLDSYNNLREAIVV